MPPSGGALLIICLLQGTTTLNTPGKNIIEHKGNHEEETQPEHRNDIIEQWRKEDEEWDKKVTEWDDLANQWNLRKKERETVILEEPEYPDYPEETEEGILAEWGMEVEEWQTKFDEWEKEEEEWKKIEEEWEQKVKEWEKQKEARRLRKSKRIGKNKRVDSISEEDSSREVKGKIRSTHVNRKATSMVVHVERGRTARILCIVESTSKNRHDEETVIWTKDNKGLFVGNKPLQKKVGKYNLETSTKLNTHESILVIHSASEEDIGSYNCQPNDRSQVVQTTYLELAGIEVTNHDDLTEGEPKWVHCTYTGEPLEFGVWWSRRGFEGTYINSPWLPIQHRNDSGTYTCHAAHQTKEVVIAVKYEPEVKRVEQVHLESMSGKREVWIRCMVDAEPRAEVTWLLDGQVWDSYAHPSSEEVQGNNFTLQIEGPPVKGEFSCMAANSVGIDTKSTLVTDDKCPVLIASLLTTLFKMKSGTKEDLTIKAELCKESDGEIQELPDVRVNITAHIDTFIDGWSKPSQHDKIVEEEEYNILREATDYYNNDWATSTDFYSENNLEYYSELDYDSKYDREYPHDAVSTKNLLRDDTDYSDNDWASSSDYAPGDDIEYYSDEHDDKDDMGSGENPDEAQVFFADDSAIGEKNPKMPIYHAKEEFYKKDNEKKNDKEHLVTFPPEEVMLTDEPETQPKNYMVKETHSKTISENQKTLLKGSSKRNRDENTSDKNVDDVEDEVKNPLELQDSTREDLVDAGLSWLLLCIAFVSIMILFLWACFRDTLKKTSYDY